MSGEWLDRLRAVLLASLGNAPRATLFPEPDEQRRVWLVGQLAYLHVPHQVDMAPLGVGAALTIFGRANELRGALARLDGGAHAATS